MEVVDQKQEEVKKTEVARQMLAGVKTKVELRRLEVVRQTQEVQLEEHQRLVEELQRLEVQLF